MDDVRWLQLKRHTLIGLCLYNKRVTVIEISYHKRSDNWRIISYLYDSQQSLGSSFYCVGLLDDLSISFLKENFLNFIEFKDDDLTLNYISAKYKVKISLNDLNKLRKTKKSKKQIILNKGVKSYDYIK